MDRQYLDTNRKNWNKRTKIHIDSEFYDLPGFLEGKNTLNPIELSLLGDLRNKKVLHLQCHFGLDSLSLARLGAKVTGIDFSEEAIAKAKTLNDQLKLDVQFICCDVHDVEKYIDSTFDVVFTSYGVLAWIPDLEPWSKIIANRLRENGQFVIVEFHPAVWMYNETFDAIVDSYFNKGPIQTIERNSYAGNERLEIEEVTWNHALSDIVQSLLRIGLTMDHFSEYDYSPYNCFENMKESKSGQFQICNLEGQLPLLFAMKFIK